MVEIDDAIVDVTEIVNRHFEEMLHEIFAVGDYLHELKIVYEDVDGKKVEMSWLERQGRKSELWREGRTDTL